MREYRFHIIKLENLSLELLEETKVILSLNSNFDGDTHEDLKAFGEAKASEDGLNFGLLRSKDGFDYWVLPYAYNEALDVKRVVDDKIVSHTLTRVEYLSYGFDETGIE